MQTFDEFLNAAKQGTTNLVVDSATYALAVELECIVKTLTEAKVSFEVIGGMAVNAHLAGEHRSRTFLTNNIDLLVDRNDLPIIVQAAEAAGYEPRKVLGGHLLIRPGQPAAEAVRLVFAGEKSKTSDPFPHPPIRAERKQMFGISVPVAPLNDVVRMNLNSYRAEDVAHLEILDAAGLITPLVEQQLPAVLKERIDEARKQFAEGEPDVW
jgi:hypothetical protein